jgi:hypothetical protein
MKSLATEVCIFVDRITTKVFKSTFDEFRDNAGAQEALERLGTASVKQDMPFSLSSIERIASLLKEASSQQLRGLLVEIDDERIRRFIEKISSNRTLADRMRTVRRLRNEVLHGADRGITGKPLASEDLRVLLDYSINDLGEVYSYWHQ